MFRHWVIPVLLAFFALISLMILRSVAPSLLSRQLLFFIAGAVIFVFSTRITFAHWVQWGAFLYAGLTFMLILTQLVGKVTRGTHSWIPIGSFHIQPSQLAIAIVGLILVYQVSKKPIQSWRALLEFGVLAGIPAALIFTEPDLGTTVIYAAAMGSVFFLSKTSWKFIWLILGSAVLAGTFAWFFVLRDFQKERITSFLNISGTHSDAQYNAVQSVIAVGSGEFYGRGIGQGVQSHLRFLPERQTDFVFASLAEETGFLGSVTVILLYFLLTIFIMFIGYQAEKTTEKMYCFLTATMLTTQVGINIGMNMGILPITGITLPMISYGGSSILSLCFHYGIVQSIVLSFRKKPTLHIK
jgi:rod shape determining protein RodA